MEKTGRGLNNIVPIHNENAERKCRSCAKRRLNFVNADYSGVLHAVHGGVQAAFCSGRQAKQKQPALEMKGATADVPHQTDFVLAVQK